MGYEQSIFRDPIRKLHIGVFNSKNPKAKPMPFGESSTRTCDYCGITALNDVDYGAYLFYGHQITKNGEEQTITSCAFCVQSTHIDLHGLENGHLLLNNKIKPSRLMQMSHYNIALQHLQNSLEGDISPEFDPESQSPINIVAQKTSRRFSELESVSNSISTSKFSPNEPTGKELLSMVLNVLSAVNGIEYVRRMASISASMRYIPKATRNNRHIAAYFAENGLFRRFQYHAWQEITNAKINEINNPDSRDDD